MDVDIIQQIRERASKQTKTIVFPESGDPRVLQAASYLVEENICDIKLLGNREELISSEKKAVRESVKRLSDYFIEEGLERDLLINHLYNRRKQKGISREEAEAKLKDPLYLGALLVATGAANGCVAGSIATTGDVIRAAIHSIGLREGNDTVSSTFLMALKNQPPLTYADCGVVPYPNAEQLADIAIESARTHLLLTQEKPKVAMLSFSTNGSAENEMSDKVVKATKLARDKDSGYMIDGEMQFDAAFVPSVGEKKFKGSKVAGHANTFIFPDLNSGNIGYKIAQRLGNFEAMGPVLAGLNKPVNDLSRGCSAEDAYNTAIITAAQSVLD